MINGNGNSITELEPHEKIAVVGRQATIIINTGRK